MYLIGSDIRPAEVDAALKEMNGGITWNALASIKHEVSLTRMSVAVLTDKHFSYQIG
jgi:hypothetical protein